MIGVSLRRCDAGLTCKLSPPKIRRTNEIKLRAANGGLAERIAIFAEIRINPWHDRSA